MQFCLQYLERDMPTPFTLYILWQGLILFVQGKTKQKQKQKQNKTTIFYIRNTVRLVSKAEKR